MIVRRLLVLVVAALASLSSAQFDMMGSMRKMKTAPVFLVGMPEVKKELKLTGDQNKKIGAIQKEFQKKTDEATKMPKGGQDLSAMMAMSKTLAEAEDNASKAIVDTLNPGQAKRLTEIQIQVSGPTCLFEPEMQKGLALTDDQISKVDEIKAGEASKMMEVFQASQGGRDPKAMQKKMKEVRAERDANLLKILSPEQTKKLTDLQGPPFAAAKKIAEMGF